MRSLALALAALSTLLATPSAAEMVFVSPGANIDGRGIAIRANGKCYVLTPAHVANLAEDDLTVYGRGRTVSKARIVKTFDSTSGASQVDLAILELDAAGKVTCDEAIPDPTLISKTLDQPDRALVKRINQTGQLRNSEALIRDVAPTDLTLTAGPTVDDQLHQGDSGSLIVVNNIPVAMLVSKSEQAKGSRFTAVRMDMALNLASGYFASQRAPVSAFRFRSLTVADQTMMADARATRGTESLPAIVKSMQPTLRGETERLLSGIRGFPQIDNSGGPVSTSSALTLSLINLDSGVRNICRQKQGKVFGIKTTYYEPGPGSTCTGGFENINSVINATFRLTGDVTEGTGGQVVSIADQFTLVLPADGGQITLPLTGELSNRMCARVKAGVVALVNHKPVSSGFTLGPTIVPNLGAYGRTMKTSC